jgi:hypothetical protein
VADCPVHGVPHRGCDLIPTEAQVEAAIDAIEADEPEPEPEPEVKPKAKADA